MTTVGSKFFLAIFLAIALTTPALAQRGLTSIPDPDPKKQLAAFEVAEGFEINLFAAEPLVVKPIQMNWDARGRLWVAGSSLYPHIKPGQKADDKIYVLEDTNHDGVADKSTVFAEGLLIPTGLVPGDGGCYVANSTELLHLADTDGDGRADKSRVVLSGFGTEDTHHILHTLRWGPDGCLYFNQSIYIHSHIETPWGVRRLRGGGVWRFRPESLRLEVFARGLVNGWGHVFDRWGQSFLTDGAGGEGINYAFPGAAFATAVDVQRILRGLNPGQPKHCGVEIISGRHLPPAMQGHLITNDFRGNRINRFALSESGSGYTSKQADDLLRSRHVAFRPVDVKLGPDGAIYVADWYNPIIQHGEVDFRDPRRDHAHGRIWRMTAKGRRLVKPPQLVGAPVEQLLEALKEREAWTRDHARRQLQERGAKEVLPALADWPKKLNDAASEHEHHRLEALWLHQAFDVLNEALLQQLLGSRDHRIRAAAVRVLADWQSKIVEAESLLARAVADDHAQVRLEAVNALRLRGNAAAARIAVTILDRPMDEFLDYSLWLAVRELSPQWLPAVKKDAGSFGGKVSHLLFALKSANDPDVADVAEQLLRKGQVADADRPAVMQMLAALGGRRHLRLVFDDALAGRARASLLAALEQAARQNRERTPEGDLSALAQLVSDKKDAGVQGTAMRLAGLWRVKSLRPALVDTAKTTEEEPLRQAAVEGIALLGDSESRQVLLELSRAPHKLAVRLTAVTGLAAVDLNAAAEQAIIILAETPRGTNPAPVFTAFLSRRGGDEALVKALAGKRLSGEIAAAGLRQISSTGREAAHLAAALKTAGGLDPLAKAPSPEELKQLITDVQSKADARRGELIYRRAELACMKCHAIGGVGGQVGPDMISLGASAQVDYLIESLIEPSKKIKENYHTVNVLTGDGRSLAGVLVRKTDTHLLLRDQNDEPLSIALNNIDKQEMSRLSLMPVDTIKSLRRDELVDLVRFLSELGKTGGLVPPKGQVVRRWRTLSNNPAVTDVLRHHGAAHAASGDAALVWSPAYSLVSGELPLEGLPWQGYVDGKNYQFLQFELRVTAAGKMGLAFNNAAGLRVWIGKRELRTGGTVQMDLAVGTQAVTLASESALRKMKPLRAELVEIPKSPGRAEVVLGK